MSAENSNEKYDEETVHNLLSVPLEFILSHTQQKSIKRNSSSTTRKRKLLHGEASCLIKVRLLASEIDLLLQNASEILGKRIKCRQYSKTIASLVVPLQKQSSQDQNQNQEQEQPTSTTEQVEKSQNLSPQSQQYTFANHPYLTPRMRLQLRSVLPILHSHGEYSCMSKLSYVESEIRRCLNELYICSQTLHQFSEQNINVAEQLSEMFAIQEEEWEDVENQPDATSLRKGNAFAKEKLIVGEIEEAICSRINSLIKMSVPDSDSGSIEDTDNDANHDNEDNDNDEDANIPPDLSLSLDVFDIEKDPETGHFISMKMLCSRLENSMSNQKKKGKIDETNNSPPTSNKIQLNEQEETKMNATSSSNNPEEKKTTKTLEDTNEHKIPEISNDINAEADVCDSMEHVEEPPRISIDDLRTHSVDVAATTLSALRNDL